MLGKRIQCVIICVLVLVIRPCLVSEYVIIISVVSSNACFFMHASHGIKWATCQWFYHLCFFASRISTIFCSAWASMSMHWVRASLVRWWVATSSWSLSCISLRALHCREHSRVLVLLKRAPGSWIGENVRQDRGWTLRKQCYTWEDQNFVHLRRILIRIIIIITLYWW